MTHRGSWGPGSGMPYALCMYFALFSIFSAGNGHLNGTNSFIKKHYLAFYAPIQTFLRDISSIFGLLINELFSRKMTYAFFKRVEKTQ